MIAFVGGGGKTSSMFRMARELKELSMRVLVTTTTAIMAPPKSFCDRMFLLDTAKPDEIKDMDIDGGSITVLGDHIGPDGKMKGLDCGILSEIFLSPVFDMILVEADGSKGRPIKAPDLHEPVIPLESSLVIGIIGFDSYGMKIDDEWVHRPHLLARICGRREGDVIDDDVITGLVLSREGLFKGAPERAGKIFFLNKVEAGRGQSSAERIGRRIINQGEGIDTIMIGSVLSEEPILTILEAKK
ncbi:MAG: putative selenium-dependent hydroxylase accessory protein YqeC [Oligoflexales bacterium]|nr:putative selenium-dependent hydroxylase accessory protein YqeC [Oligoflexales bacterium]